MIYNVKTIQYLDSLQVRLYKKPVLSIAERKYTDGNYTVEKEESKRLDSPLSCPENPFSDSPPSSIKTLDTTFQMKEYLSLKTSMSRTINKIYSLSRSNRWDYFITLTINPAILDSSDYELLMNKISIWLSNLKARYSSNLKYLIVPELHKDGVKWHFHGLLSDIGNLPMKFSGKVCIGKYIFDYSKKPYATKIYNLPLWKYGFSTATKVNSSSCSANYITKYITKQSCQKIPNKKRYLASRNLSLPVEKTYLIPGEYFELLIENNLPHIDYMKKVPVEHIKQEVTYIEFNSGGSQDE